MYFSTAAALLFGLVARIIIDKFYIRAYDPFGADDPASIADILLLGLTQGVGLYYALMEFPEVAIAVGFAIAGYLTYDFMDTQDVSKLTTTLLGVACGVIVTDVLSQLIDDTYLVEYTNDRTSEVGTADGPAPTRRRRLVKFVSDQTEIESIPPSRPSHRTRARALSDTTTRWQTDVTAPTDITALSMASSDSLDYTTSMSPQEREIATLRARAALADSERRRFKEEKKWAVSQGNSARAAQMSWQVKRYTALMQSFTREADARLIESQPQQAPQQEQPRPVPPPQPPRPVTFPTEKARLARRAEKQPERSTTENLGTRTTSVTVDMPRGYSRHRRTSTGTLKSAIRIR